MYARTREELRGAALEVEMDAEAREASLDSQPLYELL